MRHISNQQQSSASELSEKLPENQADNSNRSLRGPIVPARYGTSPNPAIPPSQLLLPSSSNAIHKRRSTINSLSPITGSNSSSLVNLVNSSKPHNRDESHRLQSVSSNPGESINRDICADVVENQNEVNLDFSQPSEDGLGDSTIWLENSESLVIPTDRARSSSMSETKQPNQASRVTLQIPTCRQTRASSVGNIPVVKPPVPESCEHWRITFHKASSRTELQKAEQDPKSVKSRKSSKEFYLKLDLVGQSNATPTSESCLNHRPPQVPPSTPIEPPSMIIEANGKLEGPKQPIMGPNAREFARKSRRHKKERQGRQKPSSSSNSDSHSSLNSSPEFKFKNVHHIGDRRQSESVLISPDEEHSSGENVSHQGTNGLDRSKSYKKFEVVKEIDLVGARTIDTSADEEDNEQSQDSMSSSPSSSSSSSEIIGTEDKRRNEKIKTSAEPSDAEKFRKPLQASNSFHNSLLSCDTNVNQRARRCSESPQSKPNTSDASQINVEAQRRPQSIQHQTLGQTTSSVGCGNSGSRSTVFRGSCQHNPAELPQFMMPASKAGVIVSSWSPRISKRRSSNASAVSAFAAATAASDNPLLTQPPASMITNIPSSPKRSSNPSEHQSASQQRQSMQRISNLISDASSSLCNSRASSRLSSSAGLDGFSGSTFSPFNHSQSSLLPNQANMTKGNGGFGSTGAPPDSRHQTLNSPGSGSPGSSRPFANKRNSGVSTPQGDSDPNSSGVKSARAVATLRVLSVLRHWLSKHSQDFVNDIRLSNLTQEFLHELIEDPRLLNAEHKSAIQLHQMVEKAAHSRSQQVDLDLLLAAPTKPSVDSIETLSALEIAEGMTYIDHKIFLAIRSEEFLGQAWMKLDKAVRAPHILLMTKRFNDVSRLVSSEIIRVSDLHRRVAVIEKWANVAHICRVVHNFNGVLQICAAFTNSAVFRLKKTWDKITKTVSSEDCNRLDMIHNFCFCI